MLLSSVSSVVSVGSSGEVWVEVMLLGVQFSFQFGLLLFSVCVFLFGVGVLCCSSIWVGVLENCWISCIWLVLFGKGGRVCSSCCRLIVSSSVFCRFWLVLCIGVVLYSSQCWLILQVLVVMFWLFFIWCRIFRVVKLIGLGLLLFWVVWLGVFRWVLIMLFQVSRLSWVVSMWVVLLFCRVLRVRGLVVVVWVLVVSCCKVWCKVLVWFLVQVVFNWCCCVLLVLLKMLNQSRVLVVVMFSRLVFMLGSRFLLLVCLDVVLCGFFFGLSRLFNLFLFLVVCWKSFMLCFFGVLFCVWGQWLLEWLKLLVLCWFLLNVLISLKCVCIIGISINCVMCLLMVMVNGDLLWFQYDIISLFWQFELIRLIRLFSMMLCLWFRLECGRIRVVRLGLVMQMDRLVGISRVWFGLRMLFFLSMVCRFRLVEFGVVYCGSGKLEFRWGLRILVWRECISNLLLVEVVGDEGDQLVSDFVFVGLGEGVWMQVVVDYCDCVFVVVEVD